MRLVGSVSVPTGSTLAAGVRVLVRVASGITAEVTNPQGAPSGADFEIVAKVVCTADGDVQKCWAVLSGLDNAGTAAFAPRALKLGPEEDRTVAVSMISGNTADSVTFHVCELWG